MKNTIILLTLLALSACGGSKHNDMKAIPNEEPVKVWTTINAFNDDGEQSHFFVDYELIESLPVPVKSIIARYTAFIPEDAGIAYALGGFSTLEEARNALLKGRAYKKLVVPYGITSLYLKETGNSLFFEHGDGYGDAGTDEFKINRRGKIIYMK